jgi:hypothetical protein
MGSALSVMPAGAVSSRVQVLNCEDLLCYILTFNDGRTKVTVLPLVCKAWNKASKCPASWYALRFETIAEEEKHLQDVKNLWPFEMIRDVSAYLWKNDATSHLRSISLDVYNNKVTDAQLREVAEYVQFRKSTPKHPLTLLLASDINLSWETFTALSQLFAFEDLALDAVGVDLSAFTEPNLENLILTQASTEHFHALQPTKLPRLKTLAIDCLDNFDVVEVDQIDLSDKYFPILQQLTSFSLLPSCLINVVPQLDGLTFFKVSAEHNMKSLKVWLSSMPNLEDLMVRCPVLSELPDVLFTLHHLQGVRFIDVECDNDPIIIMQTVKKLVEALPNIQKVAVRGRVYNNGEFSACIVTHYQLTGVIELEVTDIDLVAIMLDPALLPPNSHYLQLICGDHDYDRFSIERFEAAFPTPLPVKLINLACACTMAEFVRVIATLARTDSIEVITVMPDLHEDDFVVLEDFDCFTQLQQLPDLHEFTIRLVPNRDIYFNIDEVADKLCTVLPGCPVRVYLPFQ